LARLPEVFIDSNNQIPKDLVHHLQLPVQLANEFSGTLNQVDHIGPLFVPPNLVGQPSSAPIFGLRNPAIKTGHDRFHLGMEIADAVFSDLRRNDVHQFVLS
jgi:hypothetical protein